MAPAANDNKYGSIGTTVLVSNIVIMMILDVALG